MYDIQTQLSGGAITCIVSHSFLSLSYINLLCDSFALVSCGCWKESTPERINWFTYIFSDFLSQRFNIKNYKISNCSNLSYILEVRFSTWSWWQDVHKLVVCETVVILNLYMIYSWSIFGFDAGEISLPADPDALNLCCCRWSCKHGPTAAAYIIPFPAFNWKLQSYLKTKLLPKNEVTNE